MSGYNYSEFISDFGTRTMKNQEIIDGLKEQDRVAGVAEEELNSRHYEVTQLINSLLGLLIVPYEKYKFKPNSCSSMTEEDLKRTKEYFMIAEIVISLEKNNRLYNGYYDRYIVSSFIRHLRNSLAHSGNNGIQFMPIEKKKAIKSVLFHDEDDKGHEFCVELSIDDIRKLTQLLSDMYRKLEHYKEIDDLPMFKKRYDTYLSLMRSSKKNWAISFETSLKNDEKKRRKDYL